MGNRNYSSTVTERTLAAAMSSSTSGTTTSMQLNTTSAVPTFPFTMVIAPDTTAEEIVTVTGADTPANTFLVTRGQEGTAAVAHGTTTDGASTKVRHMITARDLQEAQDHFDDTSNVHGITDTSLLITESNTKTLTNKTLTGPIINTPTISTASISGSAISGGTLTGTTINGGTVTGTLTNNGTITNGGTINSGTVNPTILRQNSITLPLAFSSGLVTASISSSTNTTVSITFPTSRFTVAPVIVASTGNSLYSCAISSTTTSGASIVVRRIDGTSVTATVDVYWTAIQQTSTAYTAGTAGQ